MKHRVFRNILPWLLALLCLCVVVSCGDVTEGTDTLAESSSDEESSSLPGEESQDTATVAVGETDAASGDPSTAESATDPTTDPTTEPTTDPATEPTTEPASETETQAPETEGQSISFAVISDVHLGKTNLPIDPADKFAAALDTINRILGTPDALVVAGDMTDLGKDEQYEQFNAILGEHLKEGTALCAVMGNHEYFRDGVVRFGGESRKFLNQCYTAYEKAVGERNTDTVVGGMHIIGISPTNSAADYTSATEYLCEHVRAAAEEDPTMPIIVVTHEGFSGQYGSGGGTYAAELTRLLREYPQIISFSGHNHYALNDPRMIQQSTYTAIQTSTVGADFWNAADGSTQPEGREVASQGLLVTVSPERVVTVTRYDFTNDCEISTPWVIDIPAVIESGKNFVYTNNRVGKAAAPSFATGATVTVSDITSYTATLTFPAATLTDTVSDGCITGYRVEVTNVEDGAVYFSQTLPGDFHMGVAAATSFTVDLTGLAHGQEYTVSVVAESVWGKHSTAIKGSFTTPIDENAPPEQLPDALFHVDYTAGSAQDTVKGLIPEVFGTPSLDGGMAVLNKESVYSYGLTAEQYAAMPNCMALETVIYIDPDQTYPWGYVTLIGNAEGAGFDLEATVDGKLQFSVYIGGGWQSVYTSTPVGQWVHIIGSYDGHNLRLYVNGQLAASVPCTGSIKHVAEAHRKLMVGADVNGDAVPQCSANIKTTCVTLYAGGISASAARSMFAEAKLPE